MAFDPDAAGQPGSGAFGLPHTRAQAGIVLIPVPFDATVSYGGGTSKGPDAIREASMQVDLYDRKLGRIYERGIFMEEPSAKLAAASARARKIAMPIIARGGATKRDTANVRKVNAASEAMNAFVGERVLKVLKEGKVPGLVGGEHSVSFGAIRACAEHGERSGDGRIGLLQIDAHMDLRDSYEGFAWSHASVMHNVLTLVPGVERLVQVGLRDFGEGEMDFAIEQGARVQPFFDDVWAQELNEGMPLSDLIKRAIEPLPERIYVTFDIDGLDPALCPHTGTPVPGGLSFQQASLLLETVKSSGRRVVGFDLVEVAPGPDPKEPEWDANVGARILYKLCGIAGG